MFLQSSKIPLDNMWKVIYKLIGEEMLENGKIIIALDDTTYAKSGKIALDDTTYAKSGKKISGANTHYNHAAGRLIGDFAKTVSNDILVITDSWFGNKSLWKLFKYLNISWFRRLDEIGKSLV